MKTIKTVCPPATGILLSAPWLAGGGDMRSASRPATGRGMRPTYMLICDDVVRSAALFSFDQTKRVTTSTLKISVC